MHTHSFWILMLVLVSACTDPSNSSENANPAPSDSIPQVDVVTETRASDSLDTKATEDAQEAPVDSSEPDRLTATSDTAGEESDLGQPDSDTPIPTGEGWGKTTAEPLVFAASDVSQETIDTTLQWIGVATEAWGSYGPLEIWIVGKDKDAVMALDDLWCEHRVEMDPTWNTQWECANGDPYGSGIGWSPFYYYLEDGGAAVSVYRREDFDYHFMTITLSAKYPGPEEEDYRSVTMHEYFHVYQHGHIFDIQSSPNDTAAADKMGGKDKPWWAEGGAEFMAQLLYSRQPEAGPNHLHERMQWKYQSVSQYKEYGKRLDELLYSDPIQTYDVATWFMAYLVHHVGEDTVRVDFYNDLDSLGFDGAFEKNFGKTKTEYIDEFEVFLDLGLESALEILPEK